MAVDVLKSHGVPEERILFLNLIASPEGIENFATKFPSVRVVTAFVDQGLDEKKSVFPHRCPEHPRPLPSPAAARNARNAKLTGNSHSITTATSSLASAILATGFTHCDGGESWRHRRVLFALIFSKGGTRLVQK